MLRSTFCVSVDKIDSVSLFVAHFLQIFPAFKQISKVQSLLKSANTCCNLQNFGFKEAETPKLHFSSSVADMIDCWRGARRLGNGGGSSLAGDHG